MLRAIQHRQNRLPALKPIPPMRIASAHYRGVAQIGDIGNRRRYMRRVEDIATEA